MLAIQAAKSIKRATESEKGRRTLLREEFNSVDGWPVNLMVLQGSTPTGRDAGVLWFEEDRLMFVGDRTSFGFPATATKADVQERVTITGLCYTLNIPLQARSVAGVVYLSLEFADPGSLQASAAQSAAGLRDVLQEWIASQGDGEWQFPPLSVGPDAPTRLELARGAFAYLIFWVALLCAVGLAAYIQDWKFALPLTVVIIPAIAVWPHLGAPRLCWRAWQDRKALDESLSRSLTPTHNRKSP